VAPVPNRANHVLTHSELDDGIHTIEKIIFNQSAVDCLLEPTIPRVEGLMTRELGTASFVEPQRTTPSAETAT
jgi:hypothetical protein